MRKSFYILFQRLREQLWFKPLLFALFSVAGALIAQQADQLGWEGLLPEIKQSSIKNLLDTISSSMLVIAIFAVASMLSAFSAASSTATPRSFKVVVTDDVSQNALSVFIGAFIFSIVAKVALGNGFYGEAGRFLLFIFTLILFAVVILTFLRWVDRISRLGRLEHTIVQVESVTARAIRQYLKEPLLGGRPVNEAREYPVAIKSTSVGYLQYVKLGVLHEWAEENDLQLRLSCRPGHFCSNSNLVHLKDLKELSLEEAEQKINEAFVIGHTRQYDDDPRFGLIALSEIASRALSPGINDPGTAIQILGSHNRMFELWRRFAQEGESVEPRFERIEVPSLSIKDMMEDAIRPIARDGADNIEVMLRLQRTLADLAQLPHQPLATSARIFARDALLRAEAAMNHAEDYRNLLALHQKLAMDRP